MNFTRTVHACVTGLLASILLSATASAVELGGYHHVDFSAGYAFTDIRVREMHEKGGAKPLYDAYRMSSDRHMLSGTMTWDDTYKATLLLGRADLVTHSSEGETTGFDSSFAYGISVAATLFETVPQQLSLVASLSHLVCNPDAGSTLTVAKKQASTGGDLGMDWSETGLTVEGTFYYRRYRFLFGTRYIDVSAKQKRSNATRTVSSKFESDNSLGLFAGIDFDLLTNLHLGLKANLIDQESLTFSVNYDF